MDRLRALARAALWPGLSGVLYFTSWIGFGVWPLTFVCLVPLVWSLREATPRQALQRGAFMGLVTHLGGYTWIVHLLSVFAAFPLPLAGLGYVLVCAAQGFLFGVFAWLLRTVWLRTRTPVWLAVPLALCAVEWAYPLLFQSYTGVALMPVLTLVQVADLGGPIATTLLVALVNGALAAALLAARARFPRAATRTAAAGLAVAAVVLTAAGGYGAWRIGRTVAADLAAPHVSIGIAQPNVGEIELHENPYASVRALWSETAELHDRGAELVVWPEVGFNVQTVRDNDPRVGKLMLGGAPVPIIAGAARSDGQHYWNSAIAVSPDGKLGDHFDKIQLLAFGEYIPFGDTFPVLYKWSPMAAPLTPGTTLAPLRVGPWRLATVICYEDILPGLVRRVVNDRSYGESNLLVNLTNDSWYGAGHEQEQHLMLAAMRSIEHHRYLVRATSTGISAFVDASGAVVQTIGRNVRGASVRAVPMLTGSTVYDRAGDWPGYGAALALGAAFVLFRRKGADA